jgi:hypothetical protein
MIENRPAILLADLAYRTLPKLPLTLDWTSIPELIRVEVMTMDLRMPSPEMKTRYERHRKKHLFNAVYGERRRPSNCS